MIVFFASPIYGTYDIADMSFLRGMQKPLETPQWGHRVMLVIAVSHTACFVSVSEIRKDREML